MTALPLTGHPVLKAIVRTLIYYTQQIVGGYAPGRKHAAIPSGVTRTAKARDRDAFGTDRRHMAVLRDLTPDVADDPPEPNAQERGGRDAGWSAWRGRSAAHHRSPLGNAMWRMGKFDRLARRHGIRPRHPICHGR